MSCGQMMSTLLLGMRGEEESSGQHLYFCLLELVNMKLPGYKLEVLLVILQFSGFYFPQDEVFLSINL